MMVVTASQNAGGRCFRGVGRYEKKSGVIEPPMTLTATRSAQIVTTRGATSTRPVRKALRRDVKRERAMKADTLTQSGEEAKGNQATLRVGAELARSLERAPGRGPSKLGPYRHI